MVELRIASWFIRTSPTVRPVVAREAEVAFGVALCTYRLVVTNCALLGVKVCIRIVLANVLHTGIYTSNYDILEPSVYGNCLVMPR